MVITFQLCERACRSRFTLREEGEVLCWRRLTNLAQTGSFRLRLRTSSQIGTPFPAFPLRLTRGAVDTVLTVSPGRKVVRQRADKRRAFLPTACEINVSCL